MTSLKDRLAANGNGHASDPFRQNGHGQRAEHRYEAATRNLADVEPQELEWLWPGRFPLGKVSLLAGDPGLGKSFVTLDIAARVSRGAVWPDDSESAQPVGSVVLFNAEDDIGDTIRPRLDRATADVSKIVAVELLRSRPCKFLIMESLPMAFPGSSTPAKPPTAVAPDLLAF